VAEVVFFTLFDPAELHVFNQPAGLSRLAVYSLGFLFFWAFAAASSAFTCFLQRRADEINRRGRLNPGCPRSRRGGA
jgi:hypothetical protein